MSNGPVLRELSTDEQRALLEHGTLTAVVCTVRHDGRPHATPVGFVMDGGDLLFATDPSSVKAQNLRRDPRVCVVVDDPRPPYAFVIIEGLAEVEHDEETHRRTLIGTWRRYAGSDPPRSSDEAAPAASLLVRVRPQRTIARAHADASQ